MKTIILLLLFATFISGQNSEIKVKILGIDEIEGQIVLGLFNTPEGFPRKNSNSISTSVEILADSIRYNFTGLENGQYVLAVYHDENNNNKLDRNFIGIPSENYVFSNYATGSFGPPSFEDAKFDLIDSVFIELDFSK